MTTIDRNSLLSLEAYARERADFRARVIPHRRLRTVNLGEYISLHFEDELTVRYQIQEMLRVEKIFEEAGIQDELAVYGPLIPDGTNWKATMLIEYADVEQRRKELARLIDIEDRVWVQVGDSAKVHAIADEDLAREDGEKTSAVHFMRFELTPAMIASARAGARIAMGADHPNYSCRVDLPEATRAALAADLR